MECYAKYAAIGAVTALTGYALFLGHDGAMLAAVVGVISGLGGYEAAKIRAKKK